MHASACRNCSDMHADACRNCSDMHATACRSCNGMHAGACRNYIGVHAHTCGNWREMHANARRHCDRMHADACRKCNDQVTATVCFPPTRITLYVQVCKSYPQTYAESTEKILAPKAAGKRQRFDDRDGLQILDPEMFWLPATWTVVGAPRLSGALEGHLDKYFRSPDGLKTAVLGKAKSHALARAS
jgi:hypothetical protein